MVTIHWKVLSTGFTGHGSHINRDAAKAWIKQLSQNNTVEYWIE